MCGVCEGETRHAHGWWLVEKGKGEEAEEKAGSCPGSWVEAGNMV